MKDKYGVEITGEATPIKPNPLGMMLAKALRSGRDVLNAPGKIAGTGLGDLAFGEAGPMAESLAHGFSPVSGSGHAFKIDPRMVDLATAPVVGAGGAAWGAGRKLAANAASQAMSPSKRTLLGAAAAVPLAGVAGKGAKVAEVLRSLEPSSAVAGIAKGAAKGGVLDFLSGTALKNAITSNPRSYDLVPISKSSFDDMAAELKFHMDEGVDITPEEVAEALFGGTGHKADPDKQELIQKIIEENFDFSDAPPRRGPL